MIHRHWLLYSVLIATIALGGVAIAQLMLKHDALVEENAHLERMILRMREDVDNANRKYLACRMTRRIIAKESNGDKHAVNPKGDMHGKAKSWGQWKDETWELAKRRHNKLSYNFWNYEEHADLIEICLLHNEGRMWAACRNDEECRINFTERGK